MWSTCVRTGFVKISGHRPNTFDRYDIVSDCYLDMFTGSGTRVLGGRGRRCSGTGATHQYTVEYTVCYSEPNLNLLLIQNRGRHGGD